MTEIRFDIDNQTYPTRSSVKKESFFSRIVFKYSGGKITSQKQAQVTLLFVAIILFIFALFISSLASSKETQDINRDIPGQVSGQL